MQTKLRSIALPLAGGVAASIVAVSAALAAFSIGDELGTTEEAIRAGLEAKGAVIEEIETEDGTIEVEYSLDGQAMEMEIDLASGKIIELELEDEDDSDSDEEEKG